LGRDTSAAALDKVGQASKVWQGSIEEIKMTAQGGA
jgi:hypothetical protein